MKLQFRLRTLMIVVTLLAVPLGYVGWQAKIVRGRKAMVREVTEIGGKVYFTSDWVGFSPKSEFHIGGKLWKQPFPALSFLREWLGDDFVLGVAIPQDTSRSIIERIRAALPEASIEVEMNSLAWRGVRSFDERQKGDANWRERLSRRETKD